MGLVSKYTSTGQAVFLSTVLKACNRLPPGPVGFKYKVSVILTNGGAAAGVIDLVEVDKGRGLAVVLVGKGVVRVEEVRAVAVGVYDLLQVPLEDDRRESGVVVLER